MAAKKNKNDDVDLDLMRSESLLNEASDELRRERLENAWKRYGGTLIMICIAIVLGTGIGTYYKHSVTQKNIKNTDALYSWLATESGEERLETALAKADNIQSTQDWLELYYAANDALEQKKYEDALNIYTTLREHRELGKDMRWLSDLMELRVKMEMEDTDLAELVSRFEDLASAEDNPWRALAYFDAAIISGQHMGEYAKAVSLLDEAAKAGQNSAPLMSMVRDMRHLFTMKMQDVETAAGDAGVENEDMTGAPEDTQE